FEVKPETAGPVPAGAQPASCLGNPSKLSKPHEKAFQHSTKVLEQYRIRPEHQGVTFLRKRARGTGGRKLESCPPDHGFGTSPPLSPAECPLPGGAREVRPGARPGPNGDPGARRSSVTGAVPARGACFLLDFPVATSPAWRAP